MDVHDNEGVEGVKTRSRTLDWQDDKKESGEEQATAWNV